MEKKKMKLWKKILLIIGILLIIFFLVTLYKYNALTKIYERNELSNERPNRYYYSETEDTIMEFWQKDGIMKMNVRQKEKDGNITMWENTNTEEKFILWNYPNKIYQEGGMVIAKPSSQFTIMESKARFIIAMHPLMFISTKKYEDKNCYIIKMLDFEEIVEKETGMPLEMKDPNKRTLSYSFDTVTDEDVALPDLSEYKYMERKN